ncbi:hypothetical protein HQ544_02090 [Candidatus Falkowbacteria bacterium]|nr:hypothetical protein [Candidatus Falkowbacteria bacterium]
MDSRILYYQDYSHFYIDGITRDQSRAIWREQEADNKEMIFFYDDSYDQYNSMDLVCDNFEEVASNYGYDVDILFNTLVQRYKDSRYFNIRKNEN